MYHLGNPRHTWECSRETLRRLAYALGVNFPISGSDSSLSLVQDECAGEQQRKADELRSNSKPARSYICRLRVFSRLM
jgi:hypothetical protein